MKFCRDLAAPVAAMTALVVSAAVAQHTAAGILQFSGYNWMVKESGDSKVGPGPNYFSAHGVRVDNNGLHLKAELRKNRLYCAEVVSLERFGFGTYRFQTGPEVTQLDRNLVLGMFTWSDAADYHHREIDIEISRWGQAGNDNAQFVVQPYTDPENILRFMLPAHHPAFTHSFIWTPGQVFFESRSGGALIKRAVMKHDIPEPGGERARINVWSMAPRLAGDGVTEIVMKRFEFEPAQ